MAVEYDDCNKMEQLAIGPIARRIENIGVEWKYDCQFVKCLNAFYKLFGFFFNSIDFMCISTFATHTCWTLVSSQLN